MSPADTAAPVIAVDGPGGAGKGTVCRALAQQLGGWHYLDSGALYRLVALAARSRGLAEGDETTLAAVARELDVEFRGDHSAPLVLLEGANVTGEIRSEAIGELASAVAALPGVRDALVQRQRDFQRDPGLVADGRDMATVVFPDAGLKVFLTASVEERALRRYKQLKEKGIDASLPALSEAMAERDRRDAERPVAPLRADSNARLLDTTEMSIEAVVAQLCAWARSAYRLGQES